jgi:hypothetical protein
LIIRSCSKEGKVGILFGLHCNSAKTHLVIVMVWCGADAISQPDLLSQAAGTSLLPPVIVIDGMELQRQGECECFICFVLHPTRTHLSSCDLDLWPGETKNKGHGVIQHLFWPPLFHLNQRREGWCSKFVLLCSLTWWILTHNTISFDAMQQPRRMWRRPKRWEMEAVPSLVLKDN